MAIPFTFFDLRTRDLDRVRAFYTELLDWDVADLDVGPRPVPMFVDDGAPWGGFTELPEGDERRTQWIPYVTVASLDESAARALELGATLVRERTDVGVGWLVVLEDPTGALFTLWEDKG